MGRWGLRLRCRADPPEGTQSQGRGSRGWPPGTPAPTEPVEGMRRAREGAREKNSQQVQKLPGEKLEKDVQKRTEQLTEPNFTERAGE